MRHGACHCRQLQSLLPLAGAAVAAWRGRGLRSSEKLGACALCVTSTTAAVVLLVRAAAAAAGWGRRLRRSEGWRIRGLRSSSPPVTAATTARCSHQATAAPHLFFLFTTATFSCRAGEEIGKRRCFTPYTSMLIFQFLQQCLTPSPYFLSPTFELQGRVDLDGDQLHS